MLCLFAGCYSQNNFTKYLNTVSITWKAMRNWIGKGVCPLYRDIFFIVEFIVFLFTIFSNWCDLLVRKEKKNLKPIKFQIKFQLFNNKQKRAYWRFFLMKFSLSPGDKKTPHFSHVAFSYGYWINNRKVSILKSCYLRFSYCFASHLGLPLATVSLFCNIIIGKKKQNGETELS